MTDLDRMKFVQIGLHSSVTDYVTTPALAAVEPVTAGVMRPTMKRAERPFYRGDNQRYPAVVTSKSLDDQVLDFLWRGLSGNVGAAIAHLTAQAELGPVLDAVAGTAGVDPAGVATTVTGESGAAGTVTVVSDTNCANGGGVLFQLPDGTYHAAEQVSKAANVLTLDRQYGSANAAGADTILYRSCHWIFDPSVVMHLHMAIRGKGQNWERTFLGCGIMKWSISAEDGGPIKLQTTWRPTTWTPTTVGPTFAAPLAGDIITALTSRFWIANENFMFEKWSIEGGYVVQPRVTDSMPDGVNGYQVIEKNPTFTGLLRAGTNGASFGEIADDTGNISFEKLAGVKDAGGTVITSGKALPTYDCAIQAGNGPGAAFLARIPAAELEGKLVVENGVEKISVMGKASRAASGTPLRIHLF